MKVSFVSAEERAARCTSGEFYMIPGWEDVDQDQEYEIRDKAIWRLLDFFADDQDTFVSDFTNAPRLLFIDLEPPAFRWERVERIRQWVREDPDRHAVLVGVYLGPEGSDPDCFLITAEQMVFDEVFLEFPWLVEEVEKLGKQ